jgi:cellobiose phosphorylase
MTRPMLSAPRHESDPDLYRIEPCLPSDWTQAKMTRQYRVATREITIKNPAGIQNGKVTVTLDGKKNSLPTSSRP